MLQYASKNQNDFKFKLTSFLAAFYNDIITLNVFKIHQGQFCDIDR